MCQRKNTGVTLIELMLAMLLGSLLLVGLLELYFVMQRSAETEHAIAIMEGNARQVFALFEHEIKAAGHIGSAKLTRDFYPTEYAGIQLSPFTKLHGDANSLSMIYASGIPGQIFSVTHDGQDIVVKGITSFKAGNVILLADSRHVELNEVKAVAIRKDCQRLSLQRSLQYIYPGEAEVIKIEQDRILPENGSLLLIDRQQKRHHILTGVNALNFKYLVEEQGVCHFLGADQILDWSKVCAVLIDLELRVGRLTRRWYDFVELPVACG
jgi:type II secretory pathway pseudopilin PulG